MDVQLLIQVFQAFLTPLIAILAVFIALQQWRTNHLRLKLELYDRRLAVYEEVKKILGIIIREADVSFEDLLKFRSSVTQADFLFGKEVSIYLDEIYKRGLNLRKWKEQYRDYTQEQPEGYDHQKVVDEMHKELEWLTEQFSPAKEKFKRYLKLSE